MLYNSPSCSNSYYWANLTNTSFVLLIASLYLVIIYSIILLIHYREKKNIKTNPLRIIALVGIYLIGACLLFIKDINPLYGIILVITSSIALTYMRQNFSYLLLTFVIGMFLDNIFAIVTVRLCLFLLIIFAINNIRKLPKKKFILCLIPFIIILLMLISGVIIQLYVNGNRPEGYCWSSR